MSYVAARREALDDVQRRDFGIVTWNFDPFRGGLTAQALVSQTIYGVQVPYLQGQTVTNIGWNVGTAAVGTAPTAIYCGLAYPVSTTTALLLMDSANLASSAAWTTTGLRQVALTTPYIIPFDGNFIHLVLLNGAFSVTQMALNRGGNNGAQVMGAGASFMATLGTGQTTLGSVGAQLTIAAGSFNFDSFST